MRKLYYTQSEFMNAPNIKYYLTAYIYMNYVNAIAVVLCIMRKIVGVKLSSSQNLWMVRKNSLISELNYSTTIHGDKFS